MAEDSEKKFQQIEALAIRVKFLRLEGDNFEAERDQFEAEAKETFMQLMGLIEDILITSIKKVIQKRKIQDLVSFGYVYVMTRDKLYENIRKYQSTNFIGWAIGRSKWEISNELREMLLSDKEVPIDFGSMAYEENTNATEKSIKAHALKTLKQKHKEDFVQENERQFIKALKTHFFENGQEKLYEVLAWRGKQFDEKQGPPKNNEAKNKIVFKKIARGMGEIDAESSKKEIKAAEERVRVWYHKAVDLAKDFKNEYYSFTEN